jgi:hypothetical protein
MIGEQPASARSRVVFLRPLPGSEDALNFVFVDAVRGSEEAQEYHSPLLTQIESSGLFTPLPPLFMT